MARILNICLVLVLVAPTMLVVPAQQRDHARAAGDHRSSLPLVIAPGVATAEPEEDRNARALAVIDLVNDERVKAGCAAAVPNAALMAGASAWADVLAAHAVYQHSPRTWYGDHGYPGFTRENLAGGSPADAVRAWMSAPTHRDTLLTCFSGSAATYHIGVGYGDPGSYVVLAIGIQ